MLHEDIIRDGIRYYFFSNIENRAKDDTILAMHLAGIEHARFLKAYDMYGNDISEYDFALYLPVDTTNEQINNYIIIKNKIKSVLLKHWEEQGVIIPEQLTPFVTVELNIHNTKEDVENIIKKLEYQLDMLQLEVDI